VVPAPAGSFQTSSSTTVTGTGTSTEIAWAASTNTLFTLGAANLIGTPTAFSPPGGVSTKVGGPVETGPYSLDD